MRRRIIALDSSNHTWHLAVATSGKTGSELVQLASFVPQDERAPGEQIREALGFEFEAGDQLALTLPARSALIRWLDFPFAEARKIAAATPSELERQLPCELDAHQVCHRPLKQGESKESTVLAAAVQNITIEERLAPFDDQVDPVAYLGLAPFCWAEALGDRLEDGLLVSVSGDEITIALLQAGEIRDLRVRPRLEEQHSIDHVEFILRQGRIMLSQLNENEPRVTLLGETDESELAAGLRQLGLKVVIPELAAPGLQASAEQMPAAALALAASSRNRSSINFRRGDFALTGEWQGVKKRLITAAGLLAACLILFLAAGWMQYAQRSNRLERIEQSMDESYRKAFPKEKKLNVDIAVLMESKLRQLRQQSGQLGPGDGSALKVLQEVSRRCPKEIKIDIREYSYTPNGLRLGGTTVNFDSVTRVARSLEGSPLFDEVKISDTQQKLEGDRVEFRLQLGLAGKGGA